MTLVRRASKNFLLAIFVIFPTAVSAIYYSFIAADQYYSEARFVIKAQGRQQPQVSTLANLIQTTGLSAGQEQANEVLSYIGSRDALREIMQRVDVKEVYQKPAIDFWARYPAPWREDRFENLFRYYTGMVEGRIDHDTGLAVLTVRAFDAEDAQRINLTLLDLSEQLVNRLNDKARENAISEARRSVVEAEDRLRSARLQLASYRNEQQLLDPASQAQGVLGVATTLLGEQASAQAQLAVMQRSTPDNPRIPALQRRIAAIRAEIASQTGRAVGTQTGIASKLAEYEKRLLEQEFAAGALTAANAALEQARVQAQRQQFYLERVVEPNRPDLARLPNRLFNVLTVFGLGLCLYLVAWMLVVGILEHSPED